MDALTLSAGDLTASITAANTMASAAGGTFSSNAGWFILIATASLVVGIVYFAMRKVTRLGRR